MVMDAFWVTILCLTFNINSADTITVSAAGSRMATHCCSSTLIATIGKEVSIMSPVWARHAFVNKFTFSFWLAGEESEVCTTRIALVGSD